MIRWYDWPMAVFVASLIMDTVQVAMFHPTWWIQLLASILLWILWDLWNGYCVVRLITETEKK